MFMCARRRACMLRAGVEVVSEVVYREAFAGAVVMFEHYLLFLQEQIKVLIITSRMPLQTLRDRRLRRPPPHLHATCRRHVGRTRTHTHRPPEAIHQGGIQNGPQARATQPRTEEGRSLDQGLPAARSSGRHHQRELSTRIQRLMLNPATQRGARTHLDVN